MDDKTLFDRYMEDKEFKRLMAQEDLIMNVTEQFCEILETNQIKRKKLAVLMGKTKGYISQILNGGRNITLRTLSDIAFTLGYSVNINFMKKTKQRYQDSITIDWQMNHGERPGFAGTKFADDYRSPSPTISRFAS